ncbi:ABC transporter permease [Ensifer sp. YR511]|uniref:ABC transporter permease n=1 Tax=Ensifer sp. YR511 TaxID=1855294 RepID=UPI000886C683|nr:ABC transporter permease [Ensifer sp. YR511]SDN04592.1 ribose transport system permease protein [Ensifer sp. YR511]
MKTMTAIDQRRRSAWPAYFLLAALACGLGLISPSILGPTNLTNILSQQTSLLITTVGQTIVVISGGLDLSVGSVVSMTTAIVSHDTIFAIPLALLAAACVGLVNAVGILRLNIHPILMTLSSMTAVQGVALLVRPTPGGEAPRILVWFSSTNVVGLPITILLAGLVLVAAGYVMNRTRVGLHLLATGGSPKNALLGGVNARRTIAIAYVVSALLACVAGLNLAGRLASGDPLVGEAFAIDSIAATALGGTQLTGGLGAVGGPAAGVLFLALLSNGLNYMNISTYYQMLIKGGLLVAAVCAHRRVAPGL